MSKSRYPEIKEKGKCRGCGAPVPKGRQTWCSTQCFESRCPQVVRNRLWQRDHGVCCICGVDTERLQRRFPTYPYQVPAVNAYDERFRVGGMSEPFNRERYNRALEIRNRHTRRWVEAAKKRHEKIIKDGWPSDSCRDWWEADHIVPHIEGGPYILENMRTLCVPCHKKRTAEWHKQKAAERRWAKAGPDLFDLVKK